MLTCVWATWLPRPTRKQEKQADLQLEEVRVIVPKLQVEIEGASRVWFAESDVPSPATLAVNPAVRVALVVLGVREINE
jgi:hypothetical protein